MAGNELHNLDQNENEDLILDQLEEAQKQLEQNLQKQFQRAHERREQIDLQLDRTAQNLLDERQMIREFVKDRGKPMESIVEETVNFAACKTIEEKQGINPLPQLVFPKFDGSQPRSWIIKCERISKIISTFPDSRKIELATVNFEGKASQWFQDFKNNKREITLREITWDNFFELISARFEVLKETMIFREINKLKQSRTYLDFAEKFDGLRARVLLLIKGYLSESFLENFVDCAIEELQTHLRKEELMQLKLLKFDLQGQLPGQTHLFNRISCALDSVQLHTHLFNRVSSALDSVQLQLYELAKSGPPYPKLSITTPSHQPSPVKNQNIKTNLSSQNPHLEPLPPSSENPENPRHIGSVYPNQFLSPNNSRPEPKQSTAQAKPTLNLKQINEIHKRDNSAVNDSKEPGVEVYANLEVHNNEEQFSRSPRLVKDRGKRALTSHRRLARPDNARQNISEHRDWSRRIMKARQLSRQNSGVQWKSGSRQIAVWGRQIKKHEQRMAGPQRSGREPEIYLGTRRSDNKSQFHGCVIPVGGGVYVLRLAPSLSRAGYHRIETIQSWPKWKQNQWPKCFMTPESEDVWCGQWYRISNYNSDRVEAWSRRIGRSQIQALSRRIAKKTLTWGCRDRRTEAWCRRVELERHLPELVRSRNQTWNDGRMEAWTRRIPKLDDRNTIEAVVEHQYNWALRIKELKRPDLVRRNSGGRSESWSRRIARSWLKLVAFDLDLEQFGDGSVWKGWTFCLSSRSERRRKENNNSGIANRHFSLFAKGAAIGFGLLNQKELIAKWANWNELGFRWALFMGSNHWSGAWTLIRFWVTSIFSYES